MYDKNYLREKALLAEKGAQKILKALDIDEPSYVIDGVLRIEDALKSLHVGARQMLKAEKATETDYYLRDMGEVTLGD